MTSPNMDPRLLDSVTTAKAKDIEARLTAHIATHPPAPPALSYTQTQSQVIQTTHGTYTWTAPANCTAAKIECWGAGAGAGGGSGARGGEGGGGGEYACEPAYPVVPGQIYSYIVGTGGAGGPTGYGGASGTGTVFDNSGIGLPTGVFANGGNAGSGFVGGTGGGTGGAGNAPSPNSISAPGSSGGGNGSQSTGGCGGGGAGGPGGGGTGGATSGSSTGAAGGAGGAGGGGAGGAGGNNAANGNNGANPGAGGGGCGAATAASSGQSTYRLNSSATYYGSDAGGGNANGVRSGVGGSLYQGGESASGGSYNGTMKSLGVIGGSPSSDLSGKTIDSVSIRLEWLHTWYGNGAYVILGYTGNTSLPGSWNGGGITGVTTWWQGPASDNGGGPDTTDLSGTGLGAALQSGAARSICFGPGPGMDQYNYYGWFYGAGGDNNQNPLITVTWHTGSQPVQAGSGADGKIIITYYLSGVLQAALQPAAGTDAGGNAFAAGYTGPVQAVHPGSSPSVVETWQSLTPLPSGLTGSVRYKLIAEASCLLVDVNVIWSSGTAQTFTIPNFPAGYQPSAPGANRIYTMAGNSNLSAAGQLPRLFITAGGGIQLIVPASSSGGTASWSGIIPMN
jgi:hypothetical protein